MPDFRAQCTRLGLDPESLVVGPSGTLVVAFEHDDDFDLHDLPLIEVDAVGDSDHVRVVVGKTISKGGMGVVHRARQAALHRTVAVKSLLRGDEDMADASHQRDGFRHLWREAVVTGQLEHPNIVPVHLIGRTPDDEPILVMKLIEGTTWHARLAARSSTDEDLDLHLDVLMQVCRALHFAHDNSIVHRDLKPRNVMIGSFGEVYLVDWGLAVTTDSDKHPRIRPASDVFAMEGTPAYLAPEMAAGQGSRIDARSDVYLLGSALHRVVTGKHRHPGKTVVDKLEAAFESEPVDYDGSVPPELAMICNRATQRDPKARFPSAEAFRLAIVAFLKHRSSRQLTRVAEARLERLRECLEQDPDDAAEMNHLAVEARFGFQQALREWPDNGMAAERLTEVIEALVRIEVTRKNAAAARALLDELNEPPPELVAAVEQLERERERIDADLDELGRRRDATDLQLHVGMRRRILLGFGIALAAAVVVLGALTEAGIHEAGYPDVIALLVLFGAAIATVAYAARGRGSNEALTRLRVTVLMVTVGQILLMVAGMRFALAYEPILAIAILINAVGCFGIAIISDRRYLATGWAYVATFGAIVAWPPRAWLIVAIGTLLAALTASRALRHPLPNEGPSSNRS
jgi:eukaryotic-like serine/threonine-protein kinase